MNLKEFTTTPTLTFDVPENQQEPAVQAVQPQEEKPLDDSVLTEEERKMVEEFFRKDRPE